jgi:hypothetical protein
LWLRKVGRRCRTERAGARLPRMRLLGLIAAEVALLVCGCAGASGPSSAGCPTSFVIDVTPAEGTADHMSAAPGNQVVFTDTGNSPTPGQPTGGTNCAYPQVVSTVTWKSSDSANVQLVTPSAPLGGATVTATCVGATDGPVTITASQMATGLQGTGTATLTCK